ncbi:MAG: cyclic nucleotide-binding domain-containing protein [Candidatus Thiodiazotropha sp. (ex. Lucinoma kazani)]
MPNSKNDDVLLKNLVPLNTLSEEQLGHLLSQIVVEKAKKGDYLFREGDTDHQNIYLLSGTVALLSGQKEMDLISSGTPTARFALAHQLPRKHSAQARTGVSYVRIDSRMLSDMLARSHSASYEVNDLEQPSSDDWMSLLLQSPVFQQIPPANLQRVMMRMEEIAVSAGDIIINQGEDGDYFYLISKGECRVSRTPEAGHAPVELAKLRAGKGFGEEALISDKQRGSSVVMETDGVLVRLSKKDFIELVKQPLSRSLNFDDATDMIEKGALWLDVRAPEEYEEGHLPGAINLPFFSLRFQASSLTLDRAYVVYGEEVGQSATAAYLLTERGAEVFVVDISWVQIAELVGLRQQEDGHQADNVIDFNRESDDDATSSADASDEQRATLNRLKKELAESHLQFEQELEQRHTEIKLLRQALAVAKSRMQTGEEGAQIALALQLEVDELRSSLEKAESKLSVGSDLEDEKKRLLDQITALNQSLEVSRDEFSGAKQRSSELRDQIDQLQARHEESEGRLKEEITGLQIQLESTNESLLGDQEKSGQLGSELEALRNEMTQLQQDAEASRVQATEDLDLITQERDELLEAGQKAERAYQELSNDLQELTQERDELLQRYQNKESQSQQFTNDLKDITEERDELTQTLHQQQEQQAADEAGYQQKIESIRQSLSQAEAELDQQQSLNQQAVTDLQTQLKEITQQSEQTARQAKDEIATLQQTQQALQQQLESAASAQTSLQTERDELEERFNQEHTQATSLQQELQALEERRTGLDKELDAVRQAGNDADAQYSNAMESLRADLEQAREGLDHLRQEKQQNEEMLSLRESELSKAESRLSELQEALQVQKEQSSEELAGLQKQLEELEQAQTQAKEREGQLVLALEESQSNSSDEQFRTAETLASLRYQLQESEAETRQQSEKRVELEALLEQEHQTAKYLKQALETAEQAVELTSSEQTEAEQLQHSLEEQLNGREGLLQELEQQKVELQQQLIEQRAEWQDRLQGIETELNDKQQLSDQLGQQLEEAGGSLVILGQSKSDLEASHQQLASEKEELEKKLTETQTELQQHQQSQEAALAEQVAAVEKLQQELEREKESSLTATHAHSELDATRQVLESAKSDLERQLTDLQADLDKQQQHEQELDNTVVRLQHQLEELQASQQRVQQELEETQTASQEQTEGQQQREQELSQTIEQQQHEMDELHIALAAASEATENSVDKKELKASNQALKKAEQKIAELKNKVNGLREVQLEMESQLTDDVDTELYALRMELEKEQKKREKTEKQARQADVLRRERQVQETAIEMLGEDLETLTSEKDQMAKERDSLAKQLAEMRNQYTDLINENGHLHSEMSGMREQVSDSSLADDLLAQMEELRFKAENFEVERDEAKAEAARMRREVGELRSVIETYVEQIQDVQSFGVDEQVNAIRTELDMVRRQAAQDLEHMRTELSAAKSRLEATSDRDVDEVAALQASRQEMVSMQQSVSEKDHLLRMSQSQCRSLEDAIEDRDKEVDQLKRKLELLLRKTGGMDHPSMQLGSDNSIDDSHFTVDTPNSNRESQPTDTDPKRSSLGRLFRRK